MRIKQANILPDLDLSCINLHHIKYIHDHKFKGFGIPIPNTEEFHMVVGIDRNEQWDERSNRYCEWSVYYWANDVDDDNSLLLHTGYHEPELITIIEALSNLGYKPAKEYIRVYRIDSLLK